MTLLLRRVPLGLLCFALFGYVVTCSGFKWLVCLYSFCLKGLCVKQCQDDQAYPVSRDKWLLQGHWATVSLPQCQWITLREMSTSICTNTYQNKTSTVCIMITVKHERHDASNGIMNTMQLITVDNCKWHFKLTSRIRTDNQGRFFLYGCVKWNLQPAISHRE